MNSGWSWQNQSLINQSLDIRDNPTAIPNILLEEDYSIPRILGVIKYHEIRLEMGNQSRIIQPPDIRRNSTAILNILVEQDHPITGFSV